MEKYGTAGQATDNVAKYGRAGQAADNVVKYGTAGQATDNVVKYGTAGQDKNYTTTGHMGFACCNTKARETHSEYVV